VNTNSDARLRQLMQDHGATVFNLCLRMTRDYFLAEDLSQDTFLAAWRSLNSFDGANEAAWLAKIASRKCLDHLRSAAARTTAAVEDEVLQAMPGLAEREPENVFFESHWEETLRAACEQLKEPYRAVALGYYCEGRTLGQIAREKGENPDTIRTRHYRSRKMLQKLLKEELCCELSVA